MSPDVIEIVGGPVYPIPALDTEKAVITPLAIVGVITAPEPPPPENVTVGLLV
jgi:hypothetical protein